MKNNIKKLIKIANLQNNTLKTVAKARANLTTLINDALKDVTELLAVNNEIIKIRDIMDNPQYDKLCDRSKELYDKIKLTGILKCIDQLTDALDNPDKELAKNADDLIDLINEHKKDIVARPNPLKGYKASHILL